MDKPQRPISAPKITTDPLLRQALVADAREVAGARSIRSRPVPPLPAEAEFLPRAAAAAEISLTADRTNYAVSEGEFPTYTLAGAAANQTILWSLILNGVPVVQDQAFGNVTDGGGSWSGRGSAWIPDHVGFWVILAKTGDRQATVRFMVSADLGSGPTTPPQDMLGVTHVGGLYRFAMPGSELAPSSFLVEGAKHVRNLGARHLFAYLSPQYRSDYAFDDFGDADYTSLAALAASPIYTELFDLPFETFVLTAYTFANWEWIQSRGRPNPVPFNASGERDELAELVSYFAARYPNKNFILKNWEGDWQLKLSSDLDAVASEQQVAEFVQWMRARQDGVSLGRSNPRTPRVKHAIEFNLVHQAQRGLRSMLASVLPEVESDLIAYSSWWTLSRGANVVRNAHDDITFVRNLPGIGSRPLIVTEFGLSYLEPALARRTADAVQAYSRAQVPLAFYWEIFDNGPDLALVGREGTRFESWHTLRRLLGVGNDAGFVRDRSSLPQRIVAGQQYPVTIVVRNNGQLFDPVVGYALGLVDAQGALAQIVWVRSEVRAGETATLDFVLNAPATPGVYSFRMFQHGVEFFGETLPFEIHAA